MTIDEAIKHTEEVVEQYEKICDTKLKVGLPNIYYDKDKSMKCAEEHRQLAEWLKDYKRLLEQEPILDKIRERIELEKLGYPPSAGYYKAIVKVLQIIDKYKAEREDAE